MSQQLKTQLEHAGVEQDTAYYIGRYTISGLQYGCLAATPLYLIQVARGRGRGFSVRSLARYNWTVPLTGACAGSVGGYATASQLDHASLSAKSSHLRLDAARVRQDDLHLIGSVIGALVLPAVLLTRVGLVNGLLGGAGVGGSIGLLTNYVQKFNSPADAIANIQSETKHAWDSATNSANDIKHAARKSL
ncbi:uncharacterized protein UMAG_05555 [Mycosarcoma maydis]|uniref:Uncharacterized protein n=1 Tax=Mycosarcoma maydis TaxID=5270 RepID=A0A0D1DRQ6_MYCMD|nr:uncharacterized protein UMAG_05555 [Ustilago maydis 521]KIS66566.1 hypothetical protein UMAG_05555 [Ustilago maydis 521]|eukprot:XP_011391865.1 hypothetical protein UMAG_05555 [Ustilago maydis 521]